RAPPHRRVDLHRFPAGAVWPAVEAAADPAIVVPGYDLPLFRPPAVEQARLRHGEEQPERRILHCHAAKDGAVQMRWPADRRRPLDVEQEGFRLRILAVPILADEFEKAAVVIAVLDLGVKTGPAPRE